MPDSVKSVGVSAFYNCSSLSNVTLSKSLETLNSYAFGKCTALESITILKSLTSGGSSIYGPFYACSNLKNVIFEEGTTMIAPNLFARCDGLTEGIEIPEGVTGIGKNAFYQCALPSITLPDSMETIGYAAFGYSPSIASVDLGSGVSEIQPYKYAYYYKRSTNTKWNDILKGFSSTPYAVLIPKAAADYDLKVVVRDSKGVTAEKIFKVTVVEKMDITNVSYINKSSTVTKNTTITIYGRSVGGTKPVTYKYFFKRSVNTKWNEISPTNVSASYKKFTPTSPADYDIIIQAIDHNGNIANKIIKITVTNWYQICIHTKRRQACISMSAAVFPGIFQSCV